MDDEKARAKRARIFDRRARAAREGVHLPNFIELLRGMDMFGGRLGADCEEFANRILMRLKRENLLDTPLGAALRILAVSIETSDFLDVGEAFGTHPESRKFPEVYLHDAKRRCDYYAACKGHQDSMLRVAGHAVSEIMRCTGAEEVALELSFAALGWLSLAGQGFARPINGHRNAQAIGSNLFVRMLQEHDRQAGKYLEHKTSHLAPEEQGASEEAPPTDTPSWVTDQRPTSVVIIEALGNADVNQGKDVQREFKSLVGAHLPLCPVRDLAQVQRRLNETFPHATQITTRVVNSLFGSNHVRLKPLLLIGPPGSGKTTYSQRLLKELGIPAEVFPCGGTSDSAFMGTARRWSSGEPSVPLSLIRRYGTASPGVILDELEKASASRHNGSLFDCLLTLLEPQSARCWRDPYIQAPIDLSHMIWIATANSREGIPPTLLDRMTPLQFPLPDHTHMHTLANAILKQTLVAQGYDERWARSLDVEELEALYMAWPGGSMRSLQRLVEVIIDARNTQSSRH